MKKPRLRLRLETRESLMGYIFTLPFILGFGLMFLYPFFQSILISLSELQITRDGWTLEWVGLANYHYALFVHTSYTREMVETVMRMLGNVFFILVFAFVAALILKQSFQGRGLVRVIFFLPVIIGAGIILRLEQQDYITSGLDFAIEEAETGVITLRVQQFLAQMRLPDGPLQWVTDAIERVPRIINGSAIQILIFLTGLQAISPSIYEAADVEGATGWEAFWMITLPMLTPLILTNIVYTVIDFFTAVDNPMVDLLRSATFGGPGYAVGTAMAWFYFLVIAVILLILGLIVSRGVFYYD